MPYKIKFSKIIPLVFLVGSIFSSVALADVK